MNQKTFTILLALVVVGTGAWYFDRNFLSISTTDNQTKPIEKTEATNDKDVLKNSNVGNKIVVLSEKEDQKRIVVVTLDGENNQVILDENSPKSKIQKIGGMTNKGEILVLVSDGSYGGSLELIEINNPAKKTIFSISFVNPKELAVDKTGKKVAYTLFSNVETNYGYSLYQMDKKEDKKLILRQDQEIESPLWLDASKIIFIQNNSGKSEIVKVDTDTLKKSILYSSTNKVENLYANDDGVIFTESDNLYMIDAGGQKQNIGKLDGQIDSMILMDDNNVVYTDNNSVFVKDLKKQKADKVINGIRVFGWIPKEG